MPQILALLGLIAYPFASWYGALDGDWRPALAALGTLALGVALQSRGWARNTLGAMAIITLSTLIVPGFSGDVLVYAQPVLINLGLSFL